MGNSQFIHLSHNVSNLVYHIVCPAKYRRVVFDDSVEEHLKQICLGIELRYDYIHFLEIGADKDHVHFLVQSTPEYAPSKLVKIIKSITARQIFAECPQVKKQLWGGQFWSDGYFIASVGKNQNEKVIREYVKEQGKQDTEYKQLYLSI
ncbi:IS200/IS605 family transposase [Allocoprobacillus halotolerans]|uniref:IS200/IS605 family transposase n=1 Tax=Allocoprobacillus halotolerans TaxID=2944914 RepID=A0ABY5I4E5_9FIRM|nr:IS200/IS605 family transposase [Allocoprobacillus halotolerans]UTY40191.1 IS200/IS605 family transposase [Allocoprobacillus halotolerans]